MINLHAYIKKQYESGAYSNFGEQIKQQTNDYDLGCQQARQDFINHRLRHYPNALLRFGNVMLHDKLTEITTFVQGYNDQIWILRH
ncbi:hypothetical protein KII98_04445 [Leuconostoc gelidum subsp. gasicomitatum]|uniref:hypothetical protein n=1 Tax=Leuconostoc gasicomitatum TaxID=115778 RepID=UPI000744CE35|nr:hypothetical protein [Leuconostoc gasicomitatum]MBZ5953193.1 hypothetical protein [Leuconostoc gasicomitatum]MBZ5988549.1 hypothetical protein [Leuconostoc gasicomitatum]MBZ5990814.1 hypothetical protein [Leuconostoc gasicomitatum]CUR62699.1 Uncharacterized protein LEKG_0112 [Leuconostoc gasicomitatum KG16-1]